MTDSAEAAAQWWADHLTPAFQNNGDPSREGGLAGILGGLLAQENRPEDAQVDIFTLALTKSIRERLSTSSGGWTSLGVDYGADKVLSDAAKEAGISATVFPWKTYVHVYPDRVTASLGYGARDTLVWTSDDYEPVPCDAQAFDPVSYDPLPGKCGQSRYHDGKCDDSIESPLCATCSKPEQWGLHDPGHSGHEFSAA